MDVLHLIASSMWPAGLLPLAFLLFRMMHSADSEFGDAAPNNSPVQVPTISIIPGQTLNFRFQGTVSNWAGDNPYGCDGDAGYVGDDWWADSNGDEEHGIANVTAPIAAVIGVFLDDSQPDSSAAPAALDFSTDASRDFCSIAPLVEQPFFIGDGMRDDEKRCRALSSPRARPGCSSALWISSNGAITAA